MLIKSIMVSTGNNGYHSTEFKQVLLDHLQLIKKEGLYHIKYPNAREATMYTGDFHGLLLMYDVDPEYHWITTLVNDFTSSLEYTPNSRVVQLVDPNYIQKIISKHLSTRRQV